MQELDFYQKGAYTVTLWLNDGKYIVSVADPEKTGQKVFDSFTEARQLFLMTRAMIDFCF